MKQILHDAPETPFKRLSYQDGFRFGIGFFIGNLAIGLILGGLTWVMVAVFNLL